LGRLDRETYGKVVAVLWQYESSPRLKNDAKRVPFRKRTGRERKLHLRGGSLEKKRKNTDAD